jgi:hypothetical protein
MSDDDLKQAIDKQRSVESEIATDKKGKPTENPVLPDERGAVKRTTLLGMTINKEQPLDLTSLKSVKVYSPFRVYFDGEALSVSAENGTGPFDVLPGHKNFLSLLKPCKLVVRTKRGQEAMRIDRAVMHVKNNEVTVFLDV